MNTIQKPPLEVTNGDGSSDRTEELLRAFFKSEMPNPWPQFQRPVLSMTRPQTRTSRFAKLKSRMALAASIALLLLGTWLLAGAFRGETHVAKGPAVEKHNDTAKGAPGTTPPKTLPDMK